METWFILQLLSVVEMQISHLKYVPAANSLCCQLSLSGHSVEGITTAYITGLIIPFVCVFVFREVIVCVLLNREVIRELSKYVC